MSAAVHFRIHAFDELDAKALHDILKLRSDVFVLEQGIATERDIDGLDPVSRHVIGRAADGHVVATARLRPVPGAVKVERVAVEADRRGEGVGTALLVFVHRCLGDATGVLNAQVHLLRWYEAHGWRAEGEVVEEGGVPHRRMRRSPGAAP